MCANQQIASPALLIPLDGAFVSLSLELAAPLRMFLHFAESGPTWEQVLAYIKENEKRYCLLLEFGLVQGVNDAGYHYSRDFPEPRLTKLGERYMAAFKALRELQ